jgi:hypothetical protein
MAEPLFVFNPRLYCVGIRERQDMGALVQSLRSEVDWGRFYSYIFQDTTGTRDSMISNAHNFTFAPSTNLANPSTCCGDGAPFRGNASAALGAAFVFHALRCETRRSINRGNTNIKILIVYLTCSLSANLHSSPDQAIGWVLSWQ